MERPERTALIDAVTNTPRPYPQLTKAQKDRILANLRQECELGNLQPNGALLLHHLGDMHPSTEDIGAVAAEAYEMVEEEGTR